MREIKFRGKDDVDKWHFGGIYKVSENQIFIVEVLGVFIPVDPKTAGQFTDFKDMDGKEIYEDDFIQRQDRPELIYRVSMIEGCWAIGDYSKFELLANALWKPFKVIGNVYDNPELLKGGDIDD